jgi:hypothetical protein
MADPKPPQSARAARAERDAAKKKKDADRAELKSLKEQQRDAKRARNKLPWGSERKGFDKLQRDLGAKIRKHGSK